MDVESLRYLLTLAEELHFGRSARRHYLDPGHFSRRIQRLERDVGARLVERTSRRVALTAAGERVAAHARTVLAALDRLPDAAAPREPDDGALRVGVLGFGAADRWPALRDVVTAAAPGVHLLFEDLDMDDQYDAVRRGDLDVGLVQHLGAVDGLEFRTVLRTPSVVVVPASSPLADAPLLTRDDVADEPWLRMSSAHPRFRDWVGPAGMDGRGSAVRHPASIPAAVATTGRIGMHGAAAAAFFPRPDVRFVPLDAPPVEVAVVTRAADRRPAVESFRRAADAVAAG
ncbi:LysR family transcriptional regulator [Geodermatophilus sp. SYSU D01106]